MYLEKIAKFFIKSHIGLEFCYNVDLTPTPISVYFKWTFLYPAKLWIESSVFVKLSFTDNFPVQLSSYVVQPSNNKTKLYALNDTIMDANVMLMCSNFTGTLDGEFIVLRSCGVGRNTLIDTCTQSAILIVDKRNVSDVEACFCSKEKCNGRVTGAINGASYVNFPAFMSTIMLCFLCARKCFVWNKSQVEENFGKIVTKDWKWKFFKNIFLFVKLWFTLKL